PASMLASLRGQLAAAEGMGVAPPSKTDRYVPPSAFAPAYPGMPVQISEKGFGPAPIPAYTSAPTQPSGGAFAARSMFGPDVAIPGIGADMPPGPAPLPQPGALQQEASRLIQMIDSGIYVDPLVLDRLAAQLEPSDPQLAATVRAKALRAR